MRCTAASRFFTKRRIQPESVEQSSKNRKNANSRSSRRMPEHRSNHTGIIGDRTPEKDRDRRLTRPGTQRPSRLQARSLLRVVTNAGHHTSTGMDKRDTGAGRRRVAAFPLKNNQGRQPIFRVIDPTGQLFGSKRVETRRANRIPQVPGEAIVFRRLPFSQSCYLLKNVVIKLRY